MSHMRNQPFVCKQKAGKDEGGTRQECALCIHDDILSNTNKHDHDTTHAWWRCAVEEAEMSKKGQNERRSPPAMHNRYDACLG